MSHLHLDRACDACQGVTWEYAFSDNGYDLFRCTACGLYCIDPLQPLDERVSQMSEGKVGTREVPNSEAHLRGEQARKFQFRNYIELIEKYAPNGKLLDIGCGTGTLLREASARGYVTEGIELVADRASIAAESTGSRIYEDAIETLHLPDVSYDAITMINVFSHLVSPRSTLLEIARLLKPGGVLFIYTGEIGPGARKRDARNWELGDHLHWLGPNTIDRYADLAGLSVAEHQREWGPSVAWSRLAFEAPGRSKLRNAIKTAILRVPGLFLIVRRSMLYRARGIQSNVATIILVKL